jgi:hypothetical protein
MHALRRRPNCYPNIENERQMNIVIVADQEPHCRQSVSDEGRNQPSREVSAMTKTMTALAAAATMAVAAVAVPQQAQARWGHHWGGGAFFGGLAAGAIIGGALAAPYYGGYYYGGPYYGYYGGPYAYYGDCWRERFWTPYGWRWHRVCR